MLTSRAGDRDPDGFPDWKRALDLSVATPLLLLSLPLYPVVALANRLKGDRGPLLYRATRIGELGRPFRLVKFRTMWIGADGPALTRAKDVRITPVGRGLRRTKLDELPQLWNVLRGEMTLVGPRPEDPQFVDWSNPVHSQVFRARPGITGPTQITFRHEERLLPASDPDQVYRERLLPTKVAADAEYLRRRSLGEDVRILFRTLAAVVR